jgi:hypothetical protein
MSRFDRIISVRCGNHVHRIGVRTYEHERDARFEMLDHPDTQTIEAFAAFGADPPGCFKAVKLLNAAVSAYRKAKGEWWGIQWYESFGDAPIELEGVTSATARTKAEDWAAAVDYVRFIEEQAQSSKGEATMAIDEAIRGYFQEAFERAASAAEEEHDASEGNSKTWAPLRDALDALQQFEVVEDADD